MWLQRTCSRILWNILLCIMAGFGEAGLSLGNNECKNCGLTRRKLWPVPCGRILYVFREEKSDMWEPKVEILGKHLRNSWMILAASLRKSMMTTLTIFTTQWQLLQITSHEWLQSLSPMNSTLSSCVDSVLLQFFPAFKSEHGSMSSVCSLLLTLL